MSRRGSKLLDRGNEELTIYPVVSVTDLLGNTTNRPDNDNPLTMMVNVSTDRQTSAEIVGQLDVKILKISFRKYPSEVSEDTFSPTSYDRLVLRGEEWDAAQPPAWTNVSRATSHYMLILHSRNRKVV